MGQYSVYDVYQKKVVYMMNYDDLMFMTLEFMAN